jgi:predicted dehydrogenase
VTVRIGIVGTSWWADAMYLPALADHPHGRIVAVCGRNETNARALAARFGVPHVFTDWTTMLESGEIDAVVVATPNDTHREISLAALERRMPVLCDKPIGMNASEAAEIARAAAAADVATMTPFTYRCMPTSRLVKEMIDAGRIGTPYHLNLRYYTGYARSGDYAWRFDRERAGSGVVGDLGSHWLDMARWWLGEIEEVSTTCRAHVNRASRPDGTSYEPTEDHAIILTRHTNGATAILQVSAVSVQGSPFGQTHQMELHGTGGSLEMVNDWDRVQEVRYLEAGQQGPHQLVPLPDHLTAGLPLDIVGDTYRATFRRTEAMTRAWVTAIATGIRCEPDLADGARVQELVDAALDSANNASRWTSCAAARPT